MVFLSTDFYFQLSNALFEELVMDVFDEVDRRENETSKHHILVFLLQNDYLNH